MILRSIRLEDFGLYAGVTELDLVPRKRPNRRTPIVLIGGKNGAGKTTLLEAVRLALYGRRALGPRIGQAEYDRYLRGRISRSALTPAAAVALEFDYAEAGVVHRYRVRREWNARGKSIVETLALDKDGAPITAVPRDEWHQFLQELIPPGVSQLFFFDGEKISEIAEGEQDNEQLGEAIRGLLGIELVGRLRVDLGLFLARHQRGDDGTATAARLESVNRDIATAERRAEELADAVADLRARHESQARAAEQVRRQFVAEGGDVAVHRARIEAERDEVRRGIARVEHELRDLANRLLPFAMAPALMGTFRRALARATAGEDQANSGRALHDALQAWRAEGHPEREASWSSKHWADLERFVAARVPARREDEGNSAFQEVGDGTAALARLDEIETLTSPRARALLDEIDTLTQRGRELEAMLKRADAAADGVLLDELRLAEQRVGSTEAVLRARAEELKIVRGQKVALDRERNRLLSEQAGSAKVVERAELAARAAQALGEYEQRLLEHKLAQLRIEFVRCFNHLARKEDLIADVRIDPVAFTATLTDAAGVEVPKASLSAGEKQIYAVAMLWALARTSGRPLPMIIDTPLARLDSDHRAKLVRSYFPAASHQVILLSTDTEVDERVIADLRPNVSHSYRLDYDQASGVTNVSRGYFSGEAGMEEPRALQQA